MKPLKQKVNITINEDILDRIQKLAEQADRPFSQYINLVLKDYLQEKNNEWK